MPSSIISSSLTLSLLAIGVGVACIYLIKRTADNKNAARPPEPPQLIFDSRSDDVFRSHEAQRASRKPYLVVDNPDPQPKRSRRKGPKLRLINNPGGPKRPSRPKSRLRPGA